MSDKAISDLILSPTREMPQQHTPTPWKVVRPGHGFKSNYRCVQLGKDANYTTLEMLPADAARIAACVNACEGINPEAVPDLLAACKAAEAAYGSGNWAGHDIGDLLQAAIAKAEGRDSQP